MKSLLYLLSNVLVGMVLLLVAGYAAYDYGPAFWRSLDTAVTSAAAVLGFVSVFVLGFFTLEPRKS